MPRVAGQPRARHQRRGFFASGLRRAADGRSYGFSRRDTFCGGLPVPGVCPGCFGNFRSRDIPRSRCGDCGGGARRPARLPAHRPAEVADGLAQGEIFAVGVNDRAGAFEAETPRSRVDIGGIDLHGDHLGQKHIVRTEGHHLPHAALDAHGRLFDDRRRDLQGLPGREPHFAEFVVVAPRPHPAPVGGAGQVAGREVDDELPRAADYFVGVAFGAYRNVAHRRVGAYRARPRHGQQVILFGRSATAHQHGRQRIDQRPGFPALLHRRRQLAFAKKLRKNTI